MLLLSIAGVVFGSIALLVTSAVTESKARGIHGFGIALLAAILYLMSGFFILLASGIL